MATMTPSEIRADLLARLAVALGPDYHYIGQRIRMIGPEFLPLVQVGVLGGSDDDDGFETIRVRVNITESAVAADFANPDDADELLSARLESAIETTRHTLENPALGINYGVISGMTWDYGESDETGKLLAWANLDFSFRRLIVRSYDETPEDLTSIVMETEATDTDVTVTAEIL